jgi:hypothetical protein
MTASRRVRALLALAVLLAAASAAPARAGAVPDSAARVALQRRIGHLGRVRLLGPAGETLLLKPAVREDGLHMREPHRVPRPAVIVIGDIPAPPPPVDFVPWSEIDEVQVARGDPARGLVIGALLGAGVSAVLIGTYNSSIRADTEVAMPIVATGAAILVAGGALLGALLGSYTENWRTVHPPPPEKRRP